MSESQGLLARIAALRQRLEQAQGILRDAAASVEESQAANLAEQLAAEVAAAARAQHRLDRAMRQIGAEPSGDEAIHPDRLVGRARRLLRRCQDMIAELRRLTDESPIEFETDDPLALGIQQTVSMVEAAVRFVQAFPNAPSSQLRLCSGLSGFLAAIGERVQALSRARAERRRDAERIDNLAHWLDAIHAGRAISPQPLAALAAEIIQDARIGRPLRFLMPGSPAEERWLLRHVAAHSLTVAAVLARIARGHDDIAPIIEGLIVAALIHDVGVLSVPREIMAHPGPLTDEQKRVIEQHAQQGAERIQTALGDLPGLADAVLHHHERLDGSGYPAGLVGAAIPPAARWLAVADVYAALACQRPHRAAADPRTALTETLLLAEHGALDRSAAERLLELAFYPVGTVVELSNGSIGRVVAVHPPHADLHAPARPIVQVLTDEEGVFLPRPETLDLAQCDGWAVVRAVPTAQRRRILSARYPEWAA